MEVDFRKIEYLKSGNLSQQKAYSTLTKLNIFNILANYNPILTGTIPIDLDIPSSDLDIICQFENIKDFEQTIRDNFGNLLRFNLKRSVKQNIDTVIASFEDSDLKIEIFGQNLPTTQQPAYLHLLKEYEILNREDEKFKISIRDLKSQGLSTEEAFANLLGIEGDPYQGLLSYKLD